MSPNVTLYIDGSSNSHSTMPMSSTVTSTPQGLPLTKIDWLTNFKGMSGHQNLSYTTDQSAGVVEHKDFISAEG